MYLSMAKQRNNYFDLRVSMQSTPPISDLKTVHQELFVAFQTSRLMLVTFSIIRIERHGEGNPARHSTVATVEISEPWATRASKQSIGYDVHTIPTSERPWGDLH